ncbi:cobalamin-binding protein [Pseudomonas synxantha]|uniref:Vitamin B12 transport system substrate-binding protein n=1 Tax=Pseudomonas synxantha TaxID=47883 RepID=A0ACC6JPM4_9PSED|nr:cobalamin-binding protein [Pseudomonas synxantha]MDR6608419.1 vitamin B12 transport system substrate-binding protein [Pseudomonas synxantha]
MRAVWLALLLLAASGSAVAVERVVSLAPSLSEIVVELGSADLLAGVLDAGERPAELKNLPSVGRYGQLDMERLLSLKPDLLLLWPGSVGPAQRDQLKRLNIPTFVAEPHSLDQLAAQIEAIAAQLGRPERGISLATDLRQRLDELRQRYRRDQPLRVFYQVWDRPLYTVGGEQIISDALEVCGAQNVFADLKLPAPQVSVEAVLQRNPEAILASDQAQLDAWKAWPQVAAVAQGQLRLVTDKGLERPSGQMVEATAKLCQLIAPCGEGACPRSGAQHPQSD